MKESPESRQRCEIVRTKEIWKHPWPQIICCFECSRDVLIANNLIKFRLDDIFQIAMQEKKPFLWLKKIELMTSSTAAAATSFYSIPHQIIHFRLGSFVGWVIFELEVSTKHELTFFFLTLQEIQNETVCKFHLPFHSSRNWSMWWKWNYRR